MKQVLIRNGGIFVTEVPVPSPEPNEVLVAVRYSCISVGTEMSGVRSMGEPIWKRALKRPDKVFKAFEMVRTSGLARTVNVVKGQVGGGAPTGYSAAGVVIELGSQVRDLEVGDLVACAGAQAAHHAEVIRVPRNLVVPVPDGLDLAQAATVTLGAIALQGVRRANPTLGEVFAVVGLGFLGQITVQLLKANGCRVIGIDLNETRVEFAKASGLDIGFDPENDDVVRQIALMTGGIGVDGVIVTAASGNGALLSESFKICRRKARVVLVGDVPINVSRGDIYNKEIDFFISTSYGPGRYDRKYEEDGLDYPIGYVRWTENRNMEAYLSLLEQGKVNLEGFLDAVYYIDDAADAYSEIEKSNISGSKIFTALLKYSNEGYATEEKVVWRIKDTRGLSRTIQVGIVGAGAFAQSVHLPNLAMMQDTFQVRAVLNRTAHAAHKVAEIQKAIYATTDFDSLLNDDQLDLVLIAARHDTHANYALRALEAGKHVFVEKPLALNEAELRGLEDFYSGQVEGKPLLMTGFNRRFSPAVRALKSALEDRRSPIVASYRMNAGFIPLDHWVHGPEGGGRNLGEACHIYDLFTYLTGSVVERVSAEAIAPTPFVYANNDNFVATIRFKDGSVCNLVYTSLGDVSWPKEQMEIFCDGAVYSLDDYRSLAVAGRKGLGWSGQQDKGHKQELFALAEALKLGGSWPIALWEQAQATRIALDVERYLRSGDR